MIPDLLSRASPTCKFSYTNLAQDQCAVAEVLTAFDQRETEALNHPPVAAPRLHFNHN